MEHFVEQNGFYPIDFIELDTATTLDNPPYVNSLTPQAETFPLPVYTLFLYVPPTRQRPDNQDSY